MTGEEIRQRVADFRGVTVVLLRGPSRARVYTYPRHEAMWLTRKLTKLSFPAIGNLYGAKDHSTVIGACRRIQRLVDADPGYGAILLAIVEPARAEAEAAATKATEP